MERNFKVLFVACFRMMMMPALGYCLAARDIIPPQFSIIVIIVVENSENTSTEAISSAAVRWHISIAVCTLVACKIIGS